MLIDVALIPPGISNRKLIDELNAVNDRLHARLMSEIKIGEGFSTFRASNLVRIYIQAHTRRMLQLVEAAFSEFFDGRGVVALICARGVYEGLATIVDFEKGLLPLIEAGDIEKVYRYVNERANATRLQHLVTQAGNPNVLAKNVLTMVGKLKSVRKNIPEEYNFLSEIAHPNSIGTVGFFASFDFKIDAASFSDSGPDVSADFQWICIAAYLLRNFEQSINTIEAALPALTAQGEAAWKKAKGLP